MSVTEDTRTMMRAIATLEERTRIILEQQEKQEEQIAELLAQSHRGKGALWVLLGVGSVVGATLSNFKTIASFLKG